MNEIYQHNQLSGTISPAVIVAGCLISNMLHILPEEDSYYKENCLSQNIYLCSENKSTFNNWEISRNYVSDSLSFEQVIKSFYSDLLSKQEQLGAEFENVLNENMWDLYES